MMEPLTSHSVIGFKTSRVQGFNLQLTLTHILALDKHNLEGGCLLLPRYPSPSHYSSVLLMSLDTSPDDDQWLDVDVYINIIIGQSASRVKGDWGQVRGLRATESPESHSAVPWTLLPLYIVHVTVQYKIQHHTHSYSIQYSQ